MTTIATDVTGVEAVKLVMKGEKLQCPRCKSIIKTVPENWDTSLPLHGLECPNDQKHFLIHCEDESAMKKMRDRMKSMKN